MARRGRNLVAREKKLITELSGGKVDPKDYVVVSELGITKTNITLHLRHKTTGEEFKVTLPK